MIYLSRYITIKYNKCIYIYIYKLILINIIIEYKRIDYVCGFF